MHQIVLQGVNGKPALFLKGKFLLTFLSVAFQQIFAVTHDINEGFWVANHPLPLRLGL